MAHGAQNRTHQETVGVMWEVPALRFGNTVQIFPLVDCRGDSANCSVRKRLGKMLDCDSMTNLAHFWGTP